MTRTALILIVATAALAAVLSRTPQNNCCIMPPGGIPVPHQEIAEPVIGGVIGGWAANGGSGTVTTTIAVPCRPGQVIVSSQKFADGGHSWVCVVPPR